MTAKMCNFFVENCCKLIFSETKSRSWGIKYILKFFSLQDGNRQNGHHNLKK